MLLAQLMTPQTLSAEVDYRTARVRDDLSSHRGHAGHRGIRIRRRRGLPVPRPRLRPLQVALLRAVPFSRS